MKSIGQETPNHANFIYFLFLFNFSWAPYSPPFFLEHSPLALFRLFHTRKIEGKLWFCFIQITQKKANTFIFKFEMYYGKPEYALWCRPAQRRPNKCRLCGRWLSYFWVFSGKIQHLTWNRRVRNGFKIYLYWRSTLRLPSAESSQHSRSTYLG